MAMDFDFGDLDEQYGQQKVEDPNSPVPDGIFQVEVDKFEPGLTKEKGHRMFKWTFRILGPTHARRLLFKNSILDHPEADKRAKMLSMLKNDLAVCKVDVPKLSDLADARKRAEFLNIQLEVQVKTNGDFQNIYFKRRLEGVQTGGSAGNNGNGSRAPVMSGAGASSGRSSIPVNPADEAPF